MPAYEPQTILLNRYRIERFIGAGAFAEVYEATHLQLNARYALKILNKNAGLGSTLFADYVQRFRLEAQLGAALDSPHIVRVYDFEQEDDLLILRMSYAAGGNLAQRIDAIRRKVAPPMPVEEAVRIAREVALGLAALHELDAVHRDVKPSNILFDEKGRAMLADLGLAQAPGGPSMRSQMSEAMPHPGTPAYMSPEQASPPFPHLTPSSDIYSLGAVLFEMLTGRLYKNVRPGAPVSKFRKDAPEWLVDALSQMLAKSPDARPWDGEEAAEMLRGGGVAGGEVAGRGAPLRSPTPAPPNLAAEKAQREVEDKARQQAEAERKRREEEVAARQRAEAERKRREQEAAERARKEAEERARREREEAERQRRALWARLKVPETVKVPAGEFLMGSDKKKDPDAFDDETPQHQVYIDAFEIGKYPVTNEQYAVFVQDTGRKPPKHWKEGKIPKNKEKHPVVAVSWHDAVAYCQWLSEKTGQSWRLPTEAEWEKAARGADGRIYPWGDRRPDKTLCNYNMNVKDTTPVGSYPAGASPYGALDMAGNVWEWCADWYDPNYYAHSPARNPTGPDSGKYRVLRGGSWGSLARFVRSALRVNLTPDGRGSYRGFRPARSP